MKNDNDSSDAINTRLANAISDAKRVNPFKKISDIVYDTLEDDILSSKLEPGFRLNVTRLAKELGVSTSPVREAIDRLIKNGFVVSEHGEANHYNTYRVFDLSSVEIRQLFEARAAVEAAAADMCARKNWKMPINDLQKLAESFRTIVQLPADSKRFENSRDRITETVRLDRKFHKLIVVSTGNDYLIRMYDQLDGLLIYLSVRTCIYFGKEVDRDNISLMGTQHASICNAIRDGYPFVAENLMREHIELCCNGAIWNRNLFVQEGSR